MLLAGRHRNSRAFSVIFLGIAGLPEGHELRGSPLICYNRATDYRLGRACLNAANTTYSPNFLKPSSATWCASRTQRSLSRKRYDDDPNAQPVREPRFCTPHCGPAIESLTPYSIQELPSEGLLQEWLGTKNKGWVSILRRGEKCSTRYLLKFGRANEDWSEKIGSELARLIGIPHAQVDLATCGGLPATLSKAFVPLGAEFRHGNELLFAQDPDYDIAKKMKHQQYVVERVLSLLNSTTIEIPDTVPTGIRSASDLFVGYLLLDAWIGNTDRHHENWGVVEHDGRSELAPSYDHAACLGRGEPEARIHTMLTTKDQRQTVAAFAHRARGAFWSMEHNAYETLRETFAKAYRLNRGAGDIWLQQCNNVNEQQVEACVSRVPAERMSETRQKFTLALLKEYRVALIEQCTMDSKK